MTIFAALLLSQTYGQPHQLEYLDRGLVAVKANESQVYLSWRLLVNDPENVGFNVYRASNGQPPVKLNPAPLYGTTDYLDSAADLAVSNSYSIRAVSGGLELAASEPFVIEAGADPRQYLSLPLQVPVGGTTPDGVDFSYSANDMSVGDLDGDGSYEFIVKWNPSNAKDNAQSGHTGNVLLDAYELDGTLLWRIDLGVNVRAGSHYTQFMVYDLDGDGFAELACRTAEGSRDASGNFVGDPAKFSGELPPLDHTADRRNGGGYILQGPELLTVFDGRTGVELASTLYEPQRVPGTFFPTESEIEQIWGDGYGNRGDRFLAGVAYLDGQRPSLVMCRGYYTGRNGIPGRTVLAAYDWRDGQLSKRWVFDTLNNEENDSYRGQGAHSLTVGDVDGDGRDEIVYGAATIDDDGTGLYSTGIGHGDALHLSDMDPFRPGLEVWMPHESPSSYGDNGSELHDAATGEVIFGVSGEGSDVGRGVAADLDPNHLGFETWASRGGMHSITGEAIETVSLPAMNFLVWWDGDPLRELLDNTTISKWNWNLGLAEPVLQAPGVSSNNSTKSTPNLSADVFGDWREEVIWRSTDSSELRIYTTIIPAQSRLVTLMHDRQYRLAIAWQNVAYNQPPHTGFYLGDGMQEPARPDYYLATGNQAPEVEVVSPADGSIVDQGEATPLVAEASDADGVVEEVEFYENGLFLGTDISDPYTALWDASSGGSYLIRAIATDDDGAQTVSLPITVTVTHTDTYDEETASRGWTRIDDQYEGYHGSGYFVFQRNWDFMEFKDLDGGLTSGDKTLRIRYSKGTPGPKPLFLTVNGVRQTIQLPSTGAWTNWEYFEVVAPLNSGPTNTVKLQSLGTLALIDELLVAGVVKNQEPEAMIVSPIDGATFREGVDISIKVAAQDIAGSIQKIDIFVNNSILATLTEEPYEAVWSSVGEGLYELNAVATDSLGATGESSQVNVLVNNPPTVEIVSPNSGAYLPSEELVSIVAQADDGVGLVESVEFYQDGNLIGSDSEAPFSIEWSSSEEGLYTFTALAVDNRGASGESLPVEIIVNPAGYAVTYQAEDAELSGEALAESTNPGFNGAGYVNFPTTGGVLRLDGVDGGSGSMAILRLRYTLGAAGSRTGLLTVNGVSQEVEFPSTGGWSTYETMDFAFPFDAGERNTVVIESTGADLANIDEVSVLGLQSEADRTYHAENGYAENLLLESNNLGFNGTGFYNFPGTGGVLEIRDLDGGIGGVVTLRVRYALGAAGERTGTLTINGVSQPLSFPSTGSWTSYQEIELDVTLFAGVENTIRLESIGNDLGNVDEFILAGVTPNELPVVELLTPTDEVSDSRTLYVVGDSTVASYGSSSYPQTGWGQVLQSFIFEGEFEVVNRAIGGRSSRSFIEEGRWDSVKAELAEGDYVLVQFGHNDRDWTKEERYTPPEDYKVYLAQYVNEARALGAHPILVTPMVMNAWRDGSMRNVFTESGNDYAGSMLEVGVELGVPVIDLNAKSHAFFSALSSDYNFRYFYNAYVPGEYPNFPDGITDGTHFQEMGALYMAKFIAEGIREMSVDAEVGELADALMPQYPVVIKANDATAGEITLSTEFPEGVNVTVKALASDGHSFVGWKDGENNLVSAESLHIFEMERGQSSFIAYFDDETPVSPPAPGATIPGGSKAGGGWKIGDLMEFTAAASDADGEVARVEYFARDAEIKIGEATTEPYSFVWTVEGGTYEVWAEAVDNHGARGRSDSYLIDIPFENAAPTVTLVNPVDGAVYDAGESVVVGAIASDVDGTIAKVDFYVDGSWVAEDDTAPFEYQWSDLQEGSHTVSAQATDNFGTVSNLATASVGVYWASGGDLLQEAEDAILVGSFVAVADPDASAGFAVEAVSGPADTNYVEFRFNVPTTGYYHLRTLVKAIDGNHDSMYVSIDGASPTQYTWDTDRSATFIEDYVKNRLGEDPMVFDFDAGAHFIRLGYRENLFLDLVELEFVQARPDNFSPEVSIVSPADQDVFAEGETIVIEANAVDGDGTVGLVEFFADGVKLGEDDAAPYSYSWDGAVAGEHSLTAVATDDDGAATESDAVLVSVFFGSGGEPVQEAEAGGRSGSAVTLDDESASGGQFLALRDPSEIVSGGTYQLINVGSGMALEISGRSVFQGVNEASDVQKWVLTENADGYFSVISVASGEALDEYRGGTDNVGTWTHGGAANQQWGLTLDGDAYIVSARSSSDVLTVEGLSDADGANVMRTADTADPHQRWKIQAPGGEGSPAENNYVEFNFNVEETETYNLFVTYRALDEASNSVFVSVDGAEPEQYVWHMPVSAGFASDFVKNGAEAEPLELDLTAGPHTVRFSYSEPVDIDTVELRLDPGLGFKKGGTYQLVNVGSGLVLEINGRDVRQGVNEFLDTQQWIVDEISEDVYSILVKENGESLDHYPGDEIGMWTFNPTKTNQQWVIEVVSEGVFTISAVNSPADMVISPADFSDADEANVIQTSYVGDAHQHWTFEEPGEPEPKAHTVYVIGDSTVASYAAGYYPQTGWGQVIGTMFDPEVDFKNRAIGGTSSKSFYDSFWEPIRSELKAGDFVFIQFGINDANSDPARRTEPFGSFQEYLTDFVTETQAAGAHPVLVATLRRNAWNGTDPDTLYPAYHDYPVATRELAGTLGVPLVDLDQLTVPLMEGLGPDYTGPFMYMNLLPGEYPNFAGGATDNVHFQEMGAIEMARLVVESIQSQASDPNLGQLVEWIDPVFPVTITSNDPAAGHVTRTTQYAEGQNVTVKAKANAGYAFLRWEDGDGVEVTTDAYFMFEMGAEARSYHAVFGEAAPPEPDPETGILSGATYTITNVGSGLALENPSARLIQQGAATGAANQQFVITKEDDGYYTFTLVTNGERIDSYRDGQVGTYLSNGGSNQDWTITQVGGIYTFESRTYSGSVIGVDGDSDAAGANVGYAADSASDYQRWTLQEVE